MSRLNILDPAAPRPSKSPKLVVLDLDGTCLDYQQQLHPRTQQVIAKLIAEDRARFVVASGRMYRSALPWARALTIKEPLICYHGAVIKELPHDGLEGKIVAEFLLDAEVVEKAVRIAREQDLHVQLYQNDQLFSQDTSIALETYERIAQVKAEIVEDILIVAKGGSTKVTCVVLDMDKAQTCEDLFRQELGGQALVTRSLPPFIEITSPAASKGKALELLAWRYGIPLDETVAFGDANNDISMLQTAGYSVAIEQASAAVLDAATVVCGMPANAGVADALSVLFP